MARAALVAAGAAGKGATPPVPTLTYTAQNQFTIGNYDAGLTYALTNATRSGAVVTVSSTTATITAKYPWALNPSSARTMLTAAHGRVLSSVYSGPHSSAGCGPRGDYCCEGGSIQGTAGNACGGAPGTQGDFCGGGCGGVENCFGFFNIYCYNWYWTDYTSSGYTLIGSVWGKAE